MRASKDNLSSDAVDKRIRVLIKILRDLRIHMCNIDIHTNGSGIAEKDLGTLIRVPHSGTTDPEAASDAEIPETSGPTKSKRAAPSGPAPKRARETPSAAATRRVEKEKQRLKQIDTSKQSQPNIDQFFLMTSKSSGRKLPKNPKKKAKPSPASMPVTLEVEVPPKASSSAKPDPKDVINLDDLPEEPNAESSKGESDKGASSPQPPPEQPDVTSAEAPADDAEKKLLLSRATETEQQELNDFESGLKVFFAKHKNVRQLHEDLRVLVLEQKTEIEGLHKRDAESQKSIATLETRLKNYEEQLANRPSIDALSAELEVLKAERVSLQKFLKESYEKETREKKELEEKHAQATAELADKLKKRNQRIKTLVTKAKAYETEAENIDKMIFRKDFLLYSGFFILILPQSWKKLIVLFHSVSRIRMDQRGCPQQDRGI
nr:uncharacterized protein LOC127316235 [Lolium perenne]